MKGIKRFLTLALFGFLSLSIAACNGLNNENPTGENVGAFTSYEALFEYLEINYEESDSQYYNGGGVFLEDSASAEMDSGTPTTTATTTVERDYSKTNNQVEGVEEADRIITDGYKIYIVSGNQFFIVDADTLNIDYTLSLANEDDPYSYGHLDSMYLYEDKVVLTSYVYSYEIIEDSVCYYYDYYPEEGVADTDSSDPDEDITTENDLTTDFDTENTDTEMNTYVCTKYEYSYGTKIQVLDVSDTTDVTMFRELYFESAYLVDSRMIDEQIYLIFDNYMLQYGYDEELYIPRYMDSVESNDLVVLPANRIFFMPNDGESFAYLLLVSFDVTDNEAANVKAYLGSTYQIYMSMNNLYAVVYKWNYNEVTERYDYFTFIIRFEIIDNELVYKAMGVVDGSPLNQFSMDEYDGVFRIATTGYSYDEQDSWQIDNFMFLLDATTEDTMERLSVLGGLGKPNERIYSVRFNEELAYVVTFVQTDPLYKLDLSDPQNPVILGELYEDGVSDYLHVISDSLLIGIGRQVDTESEWTRFLGVKVSLYNTEGDIPVNLEDYLVEGQYSYTNVMWDHKAFLSFTPQDADFTYVAIPVFEYFEDYYGYSQSVYLFKVFHSGDLEFITKLTHMVEESEGYYRYFDSIERAVIIENYIYTVSYSSIHMFDMDSDFELALEQDLNPDYYSMWGYPGAITTDAEVMD
ncbi:beta-propeller domain-containing protein [Mycoplasmatota bacterium WC30]